MRDVYQEPTDLWKEEVGDLRKKVRGLEETIGALRARNRVLEQTRVAAMKELDKASSIIRRMLEPTRI